MILKKTIEELGRRSVEDMREAGKHPVIVILDDVRSMHNVGSVFRTCDAFAIEALYLCGYTPLPPHREIHKTALGATESVKWQHFATAADAIIYCKEAGYKVMAVEQAHNSIGLDELHYNGKDKIALVLGNEVDGVKQDAIQLADGCIELPQWGAKHSLTVSVSAGVVLWEMVRTSNC